MRIAWKIVSCFLVSPILLMAQAPSSDGQGTQLTQNPVGTQDETPNSEAIPQPSSATPFLPSPSPTPPLSLRPIKGPPIPGVIIPVVDLSGGLSVIGTGTPSSGRATLTGLNASLGTNRDRKINAKFDLSYASTANALNTSRRMDLSSYMLGPVFSVWSNDSVKAYAEVLGGGARVAGTFVNASGGLNKGHVNYPAWSFGGGAEYRISEAFGFRVNVDYLRTHFYNSSGAIRGQNGLRVTNSLVYYVGEPMRLRRKRAFR